MRPCSDDLSKQSRRASAPAIIGDDTLGDKYPLLRESRFSSRFNSAEIRGIRAALEAVDHQKHHLEEEGLSQVSFFFGILNVAVLTFVGARYPAWLWVLYALECPLLIGTWFFRMCQAYNGALFILDYCWAANLVFSVYLIVSLVGLVPTAAQLTLFLAFYTAALGPLGWACLALHNGLIFHSVEKSASLFIHMTPTFVTLALLTELEGIQRAWPGRFPTPTELSEVTILQLFTCGAVGYLIWLVPHGLWLLSVGINCPQHGYATVFGDLHRKSPMESIFRKFTGWTSLRGHAFLYLCVHAILCIGGAFPFAAACFKIRLLHMAFGVLLFTSAAWYGAGYYDFIAAKKYTKVLHELLQKSGK